MGLLFAIFAAGGAPFAGGDAPPDPPEFLLQWGRLGDGPGEFDNDVGVAVDGRDRIYVTDLNNNRVQKFSALAPKAAVAPQVLEVSLQERIARGGTARGRVRYLDPQGDVREARFHVIDGKFDPFKVEAAGSAGELPFTVTCLIAQRVTLKLVLVDRAGHRSDPERVSFTCGEPPAGNYDREQETVRPTERVLGVNLFILEDGVNTLADGARFPPGAPVGQPREAVRRAVSEQVILAITGIWDRCGVAYRSEVVAVVRPKRLLLSGEPLDRLLFVRDGRLAEVALVDGERRPALAVLSEAMGPLGEALAAQGRPLDPEALTVFATGARLVTRPRDRDHFGGVTTVGGRISLVRWDAILFDGGTGRIVPPKRVITAIAHEFGHNFGLEHLGLKDDPLNLMLSVPGQPTAVPPQPPVNLLPWQCEMARPVVEELAGRP